MIFSQNKMITSLLYRNIINLQQQDNRNELGLGGKQ